MPIYEFQCEDHGVFPELVRMGQASVPCPTCGVETNKKIVSLVAPIANPAVVNSSDVRRELFGASENPTLGDVIATADSLAKGLDGRTEKIVRKMTGL